MSTLSPSQTMALIGPSVVLVFAFAFLGAWTIDKHNRYLLFHVVACVLFCLGAVVQIFYWPHGVMLNAVTSSSLYTVAVLAMSEGLLMRNGRSLGRPAILLIAVAIPSAMAWFSLVQPSALMRFYIQNFSYGALLLTVAIKLADLRNGRKVDRVLFWVLLLFAIQFFPRTVLTVGWTPPAGPAEFSTSLFWQVLHLSIALFGSALAVAVLSVAFGDVVERLRGERDRDGLTGLLNRRGFYDRVISALRQTAGPGTLVLCDLDYFKQVNDRYGHAAGDVALQHFSQILRANLRNSDISGRIGGEEFAIYLPGTFASTARGAVERLMAQLNRQYVTFGETEFFISASFGLYQHVAGENFDRIFTKADSRLYAAKQQGRSRIVDFDKAGIKPAF